MAENKQDKKQIILAQWNANGILGKWDELKDFIHNHNIDIMAVCETKISDQIKLAIQGYNIHRKDRNRRGGGVMLITRKDLDLYELNTETKSIEIMGVRLKSGVNIYSAYAPPKTTIDTEDLKKIYNNTQTTILMGDLNAKHPTWTCNSTNKNGRIIYKFTTNRPIHVVDPGTPTTRPYNINTTATAIDIAIVKNAPGYPEIEVIDELNSDHLPCILKFTDINPDITHQTPRLNFKKADWKKFREELHNEITINNKIKTTMDIDDNVEALTTAIQTALAKSTPTTKPPTADNSLPPEIQDLIKTKNNIRRQFQQKKTNELRKLKNKLIGIIKEKITSWKNDKWDNKLTNLSIKDNSLWGMTKYLTNNQQRAMPPLTDDTDIAISSEQKAEALAKNFEKVHKLTQDFGDPECNQITRQMAEIIKNQNDPNEEIRYTSPSEIKRIVKKFKYNKAPGFDGIINLVLKNLNNKAYIQLSHIFNACLQLHYFPQKWKEATILAFHKPGKDPKNTCSYRPISLLPTMSKILENIILDRIKIEGKLEEKINDNQFGFRTKRNTVKQLARIVYDITNNFNMNRSTAALLLDSEKAFDTVWHDRLLCKLKAIGLPSYIIKIIASFLSNRKFMVKVENSFSAAKNIAAGVPQGSILGPVIYIISNNDIPKNEKTKTALFADDTAI